MSADRLTPTVLEYHTSTKHATFLFGLRNRTRRTKSNSASRELNVVVFYSGRLPRAWGLGGPRSQENTRNERFRNSPAQGLKDIDQLTKLVENEPIENFGGNVQKALSLKQMSNNVLF